MSLVNVHNEWDPLEEVIVGRAANARIARPDKGLFAVEYREYGQAENIPSGPYPQRVIEETEEDLAVLIETFQRLGVTVRRPEIREHAQPFSTPDWASDGQYNYCPRDLFVAVGQTLIEAPMTLRARQLETLSFKPILLDYLRSGSRWISAPKPRLADEMYNATGQGLAIREHEPVFDAANVLRVGRDLLYLVSDSGNRCGAHWLQTCVGTDYRVRAYDNVYTGTHVDTTITLVRPGLVVVNAARVGPRNLPELFRDWEVIYLEAVTDIGYTGTAYASVWIGLNFMMVNPETAIVDARQTALRRELEKRGVAIIPLQLRHARTLGGGFHCVTLDVRRRGGLETYCQQRGNEPLLV
ncbi:MAG: inosamine-phosphate amidinotransferase 1 [Acidobacteria bacterium]|nr:inosamine-phosphate amidinotransferase 1 [Acidobacteriota bacterium]MBI3423645.1 inosamine-phosphate amidinotransferase 1 [Acidobacteriota bacterium]